VDERTHQLKEANAEVSRQMEILNEQAKDIEISNTRLQEANLQLDLTLSELKSTQTQLVQSERINAVGMLTAGVMHEINNPNASIHSALEIVQQHLDGMKRYFLSLLDDEGRNSPEAKRLMEMFTQTNAIVNVAINGSVRILNIVLALQGFTKHQYEGRMNNTVAEELRSTATMFRYQFKDVEVEEMIPSELRINAEWSEINQAMLNLFVNAAQAGATRICVSAETSSDNTWVHLHVADNGDGMTEETKKRLFEPFYTTKSVGNSGLGLSITLRIVERHNGTIRVESERGQGTTFTVSLPRDYRSTTNGAE
jgi:signal transduction histidine kinase